MPIIRPPSHRREKLLTILLAFRSVTALAPRLSSYARKTIASPRPLFASTMSMSSTPSPPWKRIKPNFTKSDKIIGTHSGTFQADEALGVWLLRQTPDYYQAKVIRSRDSAVLDPLDIVIDVGGVYDHSKYRYDHHQRDYDERFDAGRKSRQEEGKPPVPRCTKLSASGLVFRHYGTEVIKAYYPNLSEESVELVYGGMYDRFMEAIDAIDTGVEMIVDGNGECAYYECTGLSSRVGRCNPRWNEVDQVTGEKPDMDERFEIASKMCGDDFLSVLQQFVESDLPAREFVEKAVLDRSRVHESGEIIQFESGGLPWRKHLYELEKKHGLDPLIKFVLYTDQAGLWRVQAVTVEGKAFENRLSLLEEWRGVRDADLSAIAGIPGCTFCHASGFIGGNETFEGATQMAIATLARRK